MGRARETGAEAWENGVRAASAIIAYLDANTPESLKVLRDLEPYMASAYLVLDETTRTNLELIANYQGERKGSLLAIIDRTVTPMGARRLRQWLLYPLRDGEGIGERQDGILELVENFALRQDLKHGFEPVQDLERLSGRTVSGAAQPKDLVAIKETLGAVAEVKEHLRAVQSELLVHLRGQISDLSAVSALIERAIVDDPPFSLKEGGTIRAGYDAELDEIRGARVREQVAAYYPSLKATSAGLAALDVLAGLAEVAESQRFVRPTVDAGFDISIREGRHPVVEASVGRGAFVPNDCAIDPAADQIILLTGPNMAGKSTYMRQVALIVLLAQMGSFVPAAEARIGVVDRVFTRIGAADSLAQGESTFMVEMKETANILRHATDHSLILLDEVGRGTSTFDGISIAWAVAESLHDSAQRPRTLFATHYHELTDLALTKGRIKNYNFAVKEWQGEIIFLRNLVPGPASHSYGIHVARLAGLPAAVIERAKENLPQLQGNQHQP